MSVVVETPEAMQALARHIATCCQPGDVLVLTGELGAGKTTFTQGLARGLGVTDAITSPTFVIARVHRSAQGPGLIHVDAYRVGSALELDDLDLDADIADCVTVVEWGEGKAERLSVDRLHIRIERSDDIADDRRVVTFEGFGPRWAPADLAALEQVDVA